MLNNKKIIYELIVILRIWSEYGVVLFFTEEC